MKTIQIGVPVKKNPQKRRSCRHFWTRSGTRRRSKSSETSSTAGRMAKGFLPLESTTVGTRTMQRKLARDRRRAKSDKESADSYWRSFNEERIRQRKEAISLREALIRRSLALKEKEKKKTAEAAAKAVGTHSKADCTEFFCPVHFPKRLKGEPEFHPNTLEHRRVKVDAALARAALRSVPERTADASAPGRVRKGPSQVEKTAGSSHSPITAPPPPIPKPRKRKKKKAGEKPVTDDFLFGGLASD